MSLFARVTKTKYIAVYLQMPIAANQGWKKI